MCIYYNMIAIVVISNISITFHNYHLFAVLGIKELGTSEISTVLQIKKRLQRTSLYSNTFIVIKSLGITELVAEAKLKVLIKNVLYVETQFPSLWKLTSSKVTENCTSLAVPLQGIFCNSLFSELGVVTQDIMNT